MQAAKSTGKGGGAPQPAEERWAEDGNKYTLEQFLEFYKEDVYKYWKAAPKVSGSAASHGGDVAHLAAPSAVEQRIAEDGYTYTKQQFKDHYGDHADRYWREAQPIGDDAAQPLVQTPHAGAEQMTTAGDDAPQLVDNPPIPTEAAMPTAQNEAMPCICTYQQMQEMAPKQGMGGRIACAKQRELRKKCLDASISEIDVTSSWPEWRDVLRAMPQGQQRLIIGDGIVQVKFRLLSDVQDPHYAWGPRHVFEIVRIDASAVHLHYHRNGNCDDPQIIRPRGHAQNATGGVSQPTAPFDGPAPSQPVIGRREAVLALEQLLNNCWGSKAGAVDITAGHAFEWRRFIQNTMEHRQIFAMSLDKVFALRTEEDGPVMLAFCTTETHWTLFKLTQ